MHTVTAQIKSVRARYERNFNNTLLTWLVYAIIV